jgi:hypothetical protein
VQGPKGVVHCPKAGIGDQVVASRWPALTTRDADWLPRRCNELVALQAAESGIDRAPRKTCLVDDVEPMTGAGRDRMEDAERRDG